MAARELTYEDLVKLVELVKTTSHFTEFRLKVGDIEVSLRRSGGAAQAPRPADVQPATAIAAAGAPATRPAREFPPGTHLVRAPMVGTFYRRPEPTKPPFVEAGQAVGADAIVCIVEVMKLMNSIPAGVNGVVIDIVVDDAAPVEAGQVLMAIEPR